MTELLTNEQLEAIRKRAEAATKGATPEWYVDEDYKDTVRDAWSGALIAHSIPTEADAEFIAHAREDVPALLSLVAQQQAEIERLRNTIEDAISIGEMQGENFLLDPWASLNNALNGGDKE